MASATGRMTNILIALVLAGVWTGGSIAPVEAIPIARGLSTLATLLGEVDSSKVWHGFCVRSISECIGKGDAPSQIPLTPEMGFVGVPSLLAIVWTKGNDGYVAIRNNDGGDFLGSFVPTMAFSLRTAYELR